MLLRLNHHTSLPSLLQVTVRVNPVPSAIRNIKARLHRTQRSRHIFKAQHTALPVHRQLFQIRHRRHTLKCSLPRGTKQQPSLPVRRLLHLAQRLLLLPYLRVRPRHKIHHHSDSVHRLLMPALHIPLPLRRIVIRACLLPRHRDHTTTTSARPRIGSLAVHLQRSG